MSDELILKLVQRHGITNFRDAALSDDLNHREWYRDNSSAAGPDWITLGVYEDDELRLLSFFHELGHCVDVQAVPAGADRVEDPLHPYFHYGEASAWRTGLRLARQEGVTFTVSALEWARGQLGTYFEDGLLERSPVRFLAQASAYAFSPLDRQAQ